MTDTATEQRFQKRPTIPIAEWVFSVIFGKVTGGQVKMTFPDGRTRTYGADQGPVVSIQLKSYKAIKRMLRGGALGFAEGYMAGEWTTPHLPDVLRFLARQQITLEAKLPNFLRLFRFEELRNLTKRNSLAGSKKNIEYHYDLGNDFYALWLDPSMTYSSAVFGNKDTALEQAQTAKYQQIAEQLNIKPGQKILEIGCGWGGFADYVTAHYDCHVTGLTLSREQLAYAKNRLRIAGRSQSCEFLLQDYRDTDGTFDHIVSIEMFEAVGEAYWPAYFQKIKALLAPGGRAALQVITIEHENFDFYKRRVDFIQKYIFPGGILPSLPVLNAQFSAAGLTLTDQKMFGPDYAETLRRWRQAFHKKGPSVRAQGYDDKFINMWDYYLAYCEAGFDRGMIDVGHFILE